MAKYIEHRKLFDGVETLPKDVGFTIVSIYNDKYGADMHKDIVKWINDNLVGSWSCWIFNDVFDSRRGRSFCFNNDSDRIKFILRWV